MTFDEAMRAVASGRMTVDEAWKEVHPVQNCPDCGVAPGSLHTPGCDIERCPRCGHQMIGCGCIYEVCGVDLDTLETDHPDIYENGPTEAMYATWDVEWGHRRLPWTGEWPGAVECREYGWYCRRVEGKGRRRHGPDDGWERCSKDTPGATEDYNRLATEARWDSERGRWVRT